MSKQPPWRSDISKDITDLSNYFVTSSGKDFISIFFRALKKEKEVNSSIEIQFI